MHRPFPSYHNPAHQTQQKCARMLVPLLAWICVALSLRYGYYGNHRLVLGPNSSRMLKTSSVFVEQIQVRDEVNKGLLLYGFKEQPELSLETNWTVPGYLFVDSYSRQGFSLWLNEGSRIRMKWEVVHGDGSFEDLLVVLLKGEQSYEELQRYYTSSNNNANDSRDGYREAEYKVEQDNSYYIGVVNLNPRSVVITLKVDVSSKMYDTSKATSICSTSNGLCKIKLLFPSTHYFVLTTPNDDVPIKAWYVELSFVARLIAYFVIIGLLVLSIYMILKNLGACERERVLEEVTQQNETDPVVSTKDISFTYGTTEEDPESSLCCSSEDLYDGKICVICYDERRDCFFTPCGHSATCYTCAQRIVEGENKVCPICRRLIHKARRLLSP